MALTQCAECNCKISTTAAACPHCGATAWEKKKEKKKPRDLFERLMMLMIIGMTLAFLLAD